MKAHEVKAAVLRSYGCAKDSIGPEWASLDEFALRPGAGDQRIDLLMVRAWSGSPRGHERHAIEIKVSRSDLLSELARPEKRAPFEAVTHRFLFATPKGLFRDGELPEGCGLLEINDNGYCSTVKKAARREPQPIPEGAFVEAFRRAGRAETRIRVADSGPEAVARMTKQVESAKAALFRAGQAKDQAQARVAELLRCVAEYYTLPCRECGEALTARRGGRSGIDWKHGKDSTCTWAWPDYEKATLLSPEKIDGN